jgi:transcriptional regulator with XRE-family HTH domain
MNWSLRQMSSATGIPTSTLGKVEKGQLSLTYDKLQQISQRLNISLSDLLAGQQILQRDAITTRQSIATEDRALRVDRPGYDHFYLCTDLRRKRMVPVVSKIRAKTLEEFGGLMQHSGEEFIYVVEGSVRVITEHWNSFVLIERQGVYIDSTMGHAYLAENCEEAITLSIMSSDEDDLANELMELSNK